MAPSSGERLVVGTKRGTGQARRECSAETRAATQSGVCVIALHRFWRSPCEAAVA